MPEVISFIKEDEGTDPQIAQGLNNLHVLKAQVGTNCLREAVKATLDDLSTQEGLDHLEGGAIGRSTIAIRVSTSQSSKPAFLANPFVPEVKPLVQISMPFVAFACVIAPRSSRAIAGATGFPCCLH